MRLKLAGDWSAPIVFTLTSLLLFLWLYLETVVQLSFTDEPLVVSAMTSSTVMICAIVAAVIAIASTVAAILGREVPDGSSWESTGNVGMDFFGIIGSIGLFLIGCFALARLLEASTLGQILFGVLVTLGAGWAAVKLTLGVWLVVLTPLKTVITFRGKPLTFTRHTYHTNDFTELKFAYHKSLTGGIYAYRPDTIYEIWGVLKTGQAIKLGFEAIAENMTPAAALKQVTTLAANIAKHTGLPAPAVPQPLPRKHYADAVE
ncbi:TPA: hypothetical protein DEP96_03505 [Candidatus Uhrbacteria bacterium]|nr:hypothetical protein [Candidatus Uhrbacteria bacterium]